MPIPLLAGALSFIGPMLAKKGLDLLSSVFSENVANRYVSYCIA